MNSYAAAPWLDLLMLCGLIACMLFVLGFIAYRRDSGFAVRARQFFQRFQLLVFRRSLPRVVREVAKRLAIQTETNPSIRCKQLFDRFVSPPCKKEPEAVLVDLHTAILAGSRFFESDFVEGYAAKMKIRLRVESVPLAQSLAGLNSGNESFIMKRLSWDDAFVAVQIESSINADALKGKCIYREVAERISLLREGFERFQEIVQPGIGREIAGILIGALTGGILGYVGIDSDSVIKTAAKFTVGTYDNWRSKSDEAFGNVYCGALYEIPMFCEYLDMFVRDAFKDATEEFLQYKLKHLSATVDTLLEMSRAGCNVASSIDLLSTHVRQWRMNPAPI